MGKCMAIRGEMSSRVKSVKKVTLKDVAEYCGVSPMTVSRILNNQGLVAKETAARIRKAVRQLNYTPNLVAKSLRMNKTHTFGLVMSDGTHLLFGRLIHSIMEAATEVGYSVLTANTNRNPELEQRSINLLLDKRIDGLILCAPYTVNDEELERMRDMGIPVVVIMRYGDFPADCIASDNDEASYDMVRYLIDNGIRDIYFLNLPKEHPNGRERWLGCRRAMRDNGLPCSKDRVFHVTPGTWGGYEFMKGLIERGLRRGAFVCGCDTIAVGGIKAALEAGIDIPGDMQFCGFDDIDLLDFLNVPLTTMRQRVEEMGRESVRLLVERQGGGAWKSEPARLRLPCDLVVRRSTDAEVSGVAKHAAVPGLHHTKK